MKRIVMIIALLASISVELSADLAGREYNKRIKTIEKMLNGEVPFDENYVTSQLQLLRARTTSADRVRRIERAYMRLGNRNVQRAVPPAPEQPAQPRDDQEIKRREAMIRQEVETLVLYAESMVTTADVAFAVNQQDNARAALQQAMGAIQVIRQILTAERAKSMLFLLPRITSRINILAERIDALLREAANRQ